MYYISIFQSNFLNNHVILRLARLSYRNQSINLLYKSLDWFLFDWELLQQRVK